MTSEEQNPPDLFYKEIQGETIPSVGFGTYELEGLTCLKAVVHAIETGYRHLDTARAYGNEVDVGQGIKESGIDRGDLFLTSKIWHDALRFDDIREQFEESLELLDTDYLDLVLVHWPNPEVPLEETLEALGNLQQTDRLRHFGVSNFPPSLFQKVIEVGGVFCNQVEYHPLLGQDEILRIARENDVLVTAYSPLAQGEAVGHPDLEEIAHKHGKSSEQVAIRWLIQQDHVATIPRSSNPEHIRSNFDVFDFELDESDLRFIDSLPKDRRQIDPAFAPDWES